MKPEMSVPRRTGLYLGYMVEYQRERERKKRYPMNCPQVWLRYEVLQHVFSNQRVISRIILIGWWLNQKVAKVIAYGWWQRQFTELFTETFRKPTYGFAQSWEAISSHLIITGVKTARFFSTELSGGVTRNDESCCFSRSAKARHIESQGNHLVGGSEHGFYDFPYIGNVIIPTDELHHFSEGIPPTSIESQGNHCCFCFQALHCRCFSQLHPGDFRR